MSLTDRYSFLANIPLRIHITCVSLDLRVPLCTRLAPLASDKQTNSRVVRYGVKNTRIVALMGKVVSVEGLDIWLRLASINLSCACCESWDKVDPLSSISCLILIYFLNSWALQWLDILLLRNFFTANKSS